MPRASKRWQTRIEIGDDSNWDMFYHTIYFYGQTIDKLQASVRTYLLDKKPIYFCNVGDHIVGQVMYFHYSVVLSENGFENVFVEEEEGWWYCENNYLANQNQRLPCTSPKKLNSLEEAVDHLIKFALIPEKGPDYQSVAVVNRSLQLPLVEKILREHDEHPINDLIQRGWHIIALEYKGELSITGELTNRRAVFVMGHPESSASLFTINSKYYAKR